METERNGERNRERERNRNRERERERTPTGYQLNFNTKHSCINFLHFANSLVSGKGERNSMRKRGERGRKIEREN